jgi:putative transcriptional regulator
VDSLRGQLLIASPALFDPNFRRTVVLVADHGEGGAMGIVLNRPSEADVSDAVPLLADLVEPGEPVYVGGPVEQDSVVVLAEWADPDDATVLVFDGVGFMSSDDDVEGVADATARARVFAGSAGWAAGQLEAELAEGSWLVEPATVEDVFGTDDVWARVLRRKGGAYRVLASMPLDPTLN